MVWLDEVTIDKKEGQRTFTYGSNSGPRRLSEEVPWAWEKACPRKEPRKHLLAIAEISLGRGATPKLGNAQKKGCLFLGFLPSYYISTIAHCSSSSPQNLALNIWVWKLHRMVGPTQNLV